MLEVVPPTCRAISAIDNPNSSSSPFGNRCSETTDLPPAATAFELVRAYLTSCALLVDDLDYGFADPPEL